jgi:hypothetical protein
MDPPAPQFRSASMQAQSLLQPVPANHRRTKSCCANQPFTPVPRREIRGGRVFHSPCCSRTKQPLASLGRATQSSSEFRMCLTMIPVAWIWACYQLLLDKLDAARRDSAALHRLQMPTPTGCSCPLVRCLPPSRRFRHAVRAIEHVPQRPDGVTAYSLRFKAALILRTTGYARYWACQNGKTGIKAATSCAKHLRAAAPNVNTKQATSKRAALEMQTCKMQKWPHTRAEAGNAATRRCHISCVAKSSNGF